MPAASRLEYDVVLLTDLRYQGGNSVSVAEELKAQARAGYRTAVVHVPATHMGSVRTFNRRIAGCLRAGLADLVSADRALRARLLVVRQPRIFTHDLERHPRIEAEQTLLVANQPPVDGLRPAASPYYDVGVVDRRVRELFGPFSWAPIGPLVREVLARSGGAGAVRERDWVNVLDTAEWEVDRTRFQADRPVIGRHSRSEPAKWPADRETLLAAYPDDPGVAVKILGGAEPARALLGSLPANWTVLPFGSVAPQRFLAGIDVFVYYHHPGWVEAFGRSIVEALASGCPAVLPPHFEPLFGDACSYAPATGARALVEQLRADPALYRERSEHGRRRVEADFGAAAHEQRLAELIGPPERPERHVFPRRLASRRVLLVAAEPAGNAAATRLLRVAARLPADVEPVLVTAAPISRPARAAGLLVERLPAATGARIAADVRRHGADAVLLDARAPAPGLVAGIAAAGVPVVWLRVAGAPAAPEVLEQLAAVVELGDLLASAGSAEVAAVRDGPPDGADAARAALGVADGVPLALLAPGADERLTSPPRVGVAAEALLRAGWTVVFPEPLLATGATRLPAEVLRTALPGLARSLPAFDLVVTAPGHTLVHELVDARRPALLVGLRAGGDDERRLRAAGDRGIASTLARFDGELLAGRAEELRDASRREELAAACAAIRLEDAAPRVLDVLGVAT